MQGIIAAVPTPINGNGVPQRAPFVEHCKWAMANGCDGLNILGTTGEAASTNLQSRKLVMNWAADTLDGAHVMVGTGTPSLAETVALTIHADTLGFSAALVLPPFYYKPASDDGLYRWFAALHDALGKRKIAIYFYNFPQMTGIALSPALIKRLCVAYPDRFRGIKDSSGDLDYCRTLSAEIAGFEVFPSAETSISEAVTSGFSGCISATVNHSAPLCAKAWAMRKELPVGLIDKIGEIRSQISSQPLIPAVKNMVARRSGDPVWNNVQPPLLALDDTQKAFLDTIEMA